MTKTENYQSKFVAAFINEYFEKQIYSYYPDKDRLLYVLCESDEEKQKKTSEQINSIKNSIIDLGFEELSYAIILSSRPESREYIEEKNRVDFWVNNLTELYEDSITGFNPITEAVDDAAEDLEKESKFWGMFPNSQKPKNQNVKTIIPNEIDLIELINNNIEEFLINGYWDIDFEEFENYVELSKPIELLFSMSELLVQHHRLEMFEEFLLENNASTPHPVVPIVKPNFDDNAANDFFEIVKMYFDKEQHIVLKETLSNLSDLDCSLLFKEQGNKLTDSFKKIYENGFINGWNKTDLIEWIIRSFKYLDRKKEPSDYKRKTVEQTISSSKTNPPCKNPIIEVKNGKILKIDY